MYESGKSHVYVYIYTRPLTPNNRAATDSKEEPTLSEMRCVPREWTEVVGKEGDEGDGMFLTKVWDDRGSGGRAGSFWVAASNSAQLTPMRLLIASSSHNPPSGTFYVLKHQHFMADGSLLKRSE